MEQEKKKTLLRKLYENALRDPVPIPLAWRVWIAMGFAVYIFIGLVLYPLKCMFVFHALDNALLMIVGMGALATLVCVRSARKAMKHSRGKDWNKWCRKKSDKNPCE